MAAWQLVKGTDIRHRNLPRQKFGAPSALSGPVWNEMTRTVCLRAVMVNAAQHPQPGMSSGKHSFGRCRHGSVIEPSLMGK
jgi:hypothetical protein